METDNREARKPFNCYFAIVITQCVCVAIILISIVFMKYFFKGTYKKVKGFYENRFCTDTDISEVLRSEEQSNEI